jgi:hypothetical protein
MGFDHADAYFFRGPKSSDSTSNSLPNNHWGTDIAGGLLPFKGECEDNEDGATPGRH